MSYTIEPIGDVAARLKMTNLNQVATMNVRLPADDLLKLINAAFKAPDHMPVVELDGVRGERLPDGVRVRNIKEQSWFDIPWEHIARGIKVVEPE